MTARTPRADGPRVRAVVVSWNGKHLLEESLDSLLAQDLPEGTLDVVVVDNASTDGTAQLLAERFPSVRVVETPTNLGFAGGVVAGMQDLDVDYVVLLNNDARYEPDAVRRLVETAESAPSAAAVTARILLTEPDARGRVLLNSTGNVLTYAGTAGDRDWLVPDGDARPDREVFGFCGGAALLRTSALRDVGSFDPTLFLYYEDTDLSWRFRARGWSVLYCPDAVAHHRHAASSGTSSPLFRYYNTRNSLIVFGRHAPVAVVARSAARQSLGALLHLVRRTEPGPVVRARFRALRDAARRAPRTLRERRRLWAGSPRSRRDVFRAGSV